jgi:hypothetical protein
MYKLYIKKKVDLIPKIVPENPIFENLVTGADNRLPAYQGWLEVYTSSCWRML